MRHFKELGADLPPENRALAEALRTLFTVLGEPLNGYAKRMYCDKGAVSRYLAGLRVPDWPWVRELHGQALGKAADPDAVMPREQLERILGAAQSVGGTVHQNRLLKRQLEQQEELLRAAQQRSRAQQRPAEEKRETPQPEPADRDRPRAEPPRQEPPARPIPWQLAQVSAELAGGLHMERLPDLVTRLHDLGRTPEALELLHAAARRPLPQVLHALRCLEAAGLSMEADSVVSCAAQLPAVEAVALAESLWRGGGGTDGRHLGNFLSALSLREPPAVARIADLLVPGAASHSLWWELLARAGDRCVEDVAAVMEALDGTRLVPQGARALFSGHACQGADRASKSARLIRLLDERKCRWQLDTVLTELAVRITTVQQVADAVIALHEVGQHEPALHLAPAATRARARVRGTRRWRDRLADLLEHQGLPAEAELVRRTPLP
ncbi:hypothetical protein ACFYR1_30425 [Streptomyces canus]|uniref:hypothetical protein n=1 Tax=Streptomyces canus TaxID=58343 RepID=UPI0036D11CB8